MSRSFLGLMALLPVFGLAASCGGNQNPSGAGGQGSTSTTTGTSTGGGGQGGGEAPIPVCKDPGGETGQSHIAHVVIILQENHSFDNYFGHYCTAKAASNPSCNTGPSCCEGVPEKEPSGASPVVLDDEGNAGYDPDHSQACEVAEMNGGKMDRYVTGAEGCSNPKNFAVAKDELVKPYHDLATQYALADRYFQPLAGQSSANDMYFAVAKEVFSDNDVKPDSIGKNCSLAPKTETYDGQTTIADLLKSAGKKITFYSEGYDVIKAAGDTCPQKPEDCAFPLNLYPCLYAPGDDPFLYYAQFAKDPDFVQDYQAFRTALGQGTLPEVAFVKPLGYHTEHPGYSNTMSAGVAFADKVVKEVLGSCYKDNTLVLLTWDESGGYFDHVAPPPDSMVDMAPYGPRVPLLAIGRFAKKGFISHVTMEHSSVVKFIEWNFLSATGQLAARDAVVNNLGSLLDPAETGVAVPEQ
ncbi:MAG: alkaline phosphatase family protein [Byssovorax sp.]